MNMQQMHAELSFNLQHETTTINHHCSWHGGTLKFEVGLVIYCNKLINKG